MRSSGEEVWTSQKRFTGATVMVSRCVSEGLLDVNTKGAVNWWRLLKKVALTMRVDLL
jgi:hypothetical protein